MFRQVTRQLEVIEARLETALGRGEEEGGGAEGGRQEKEGQKGGEVRIRKEGEGEERGREEGEGKGDGEAVVTEIGRRRMERGEERGRLKEGENEGEEKVERIGRVGDGSKGIDNLRLRLVTDNLSILNEHFCFAF